MPQKSVLKLLLLTAWALELCACQQAVVTTLPFTGYNTGFIDYGNYNSYTLDNGVYIPAKPTLDLEAALEDLARKGPDELNAEDTRFDLLYKAAATSNLQYLEALLKQLPGLKTEEKRYVLGVVTYYNHNELLVSLLNDSQWDSYGFKLALADPDFAKAKMEQAKDWTAQNNSEYQYPLLVAVKNKRTQAQATLKAAGAVLDERNLDGENLLNAAIANKDYAEAKSLLDQGLPLESETGKSPMATAMENRDIESVDWLLAEGSDLHKPTRSAWAYIGGNEKAMPPISYALSYGGTDLTFLRQLQRRGFDFKQPAYDSFLARLVEHSTPLLYDYELSTLKLLLEMGLKVDVANAYGQTPLMLALQYGANDNLDTLLQAGADPKAQDDQGKSVLMYAAGAGNTRFVRKLLEAGADLYLKDNSGNTAYSYGSGNIEMQEFLSAIW